MTFHIKLCELVQNFCELDLIKRNGFFRIYDENKYLVLFGPENYDAIYNRIRCFMIIKGCTDAFAHYCAKIKVYSDNAFPIEKRLTLHNVITLIK